MPRRLLSPAQQSVHKPDKSMAQKWRLRCCGLRGVAGCAKWKAFSAMMIACYAITIASSGDEAAS
jgi:hypothetical protein